jgi:hypothetical protein
MTNLAAQYMKAMSRMRAMTDEAIFSGFATSTATIEPERPPMTADTLIAAMREMKSLTATPPVRASLRLTYSHHALKETTERLFPASKHRSKRIYKKLIKRFGGEFRRQPAIWQIGDTIVAHPSFRSQLEAQIKETNHVQMHSYDQNPLLRPTRL